MQPDLQANTTDTGIVIEPSGQGIVQIRLNRPERLNALGVDMVDALGRAIADAVSQRSRVLIVRGTGRADADLVVTEYGVADLRGRSFRERATRLAAIAHPQFRNDLMNAATKAA